MIGKRGAVRDGERETQTLIHTHTHVQIVLPEKQ